MSETSREFKIACPHCGQHIVIPETMFGTELNCPSCGIPFCPARPETAAPEKEGQPTPEKSPAVPDDISGTHSHTRKHSSREAGKHLPNTARTGLSATWKKVLRPCGCFVLASVWFLLRSIAGLVAKGLHLLRIRPDSVRPVRWLKAHAFDPLDARWRRYETARISAGSDAGSDAADVLEPSLKRRCAYVATVLVAIVAILVLGVRSCRKKPPEPSPSRPSAEWTTPSTGGGREFVRNHIRKNGNCRIVSLTKRGGDVVVCDRNDWAAQGCPRDMINALRKAADEHEKIVDVTITENGRWLVLWGMNAGAWRGIPPGLESSLRQFNRNGETVYSATFNDSGDWIAISDEHYNAAGSIATWLEEGARKFGILRAACVSENAAVAVFDGGYKFFGPVPEDLKEALRKTSLDVRIVKIAGSAWFFADEYGSYQFRM